MNRRQQAIEFFVAQGWTLAQACGIAANLEAESAWNENIVGDGGAAYGIAQWHAPRQSNFAALMGKPIQGSTFEEQLHFVHAELRGEERKAGDALAASTNAAEAAEVVCRLYERPADPDGDSIKRAALAERIFAAQIDAGATPAEPRPPTPTPHSYDLPRSQPSAGGSMLAMLLTTLASGFAPLLQAKLNGALGKAGADPALGAQLTGQIMGAVQQVAGQFNPAALNDPVVAVATIRTNPAAQAQAEKAVSEKLDELLPLFDRLQQYQQAEWDNAEKEKKAAHERTVAMSKEGPLYKNAAFVVGMFMLMMVLGVTATVLWKDVIAAAMKVPEIKGYSAEIQSFVIGAICGSGLMAVLQYFLGSSSGSAAKTTLIGEIATRTK